MLRIREAIVVEGRYDKHALAGTVDAVIIPTLATAIVDGTAPHGCATPGHFSRKKTAHPGLGHAVCMMRVMPSGLDSGAC